MFSVAMPQHMTLQSTMVLELIRAEYTTPALPPPLSHPPPQKTSLLTMLQTPTITSSAKPSTQLQSKARLCMPVFPVAMVVSMSRFCLLVKSVLVRSTTTSLVSRFDRREEGKVDSFSPDRERLDKEEGE